MDEATPAEKLPAASPKAGEGTPQAIDIRAKGTHKVSTEKQPSRLSHNNVVGIGAVLGVALGFGFGFFFWPHPLVLMFAPIVGIGLGAMVAYSLWEKQQASSALSRFQGYGALAEDMMFFSEWASFSDCDFYVVSQDDQGTPQRLIFTNPAPPFTSRLIHERTDFRPLLKNVAGRVAPGFGVRLEAEPRGEAYFVRLRLELPKAWRDILHPCVASASTPLHEWLECEPFVGEEELGARPFLWDLLNEGDVDALKRLIDGPFWCVAMAREWVPLGVSKAYWDEDGALFLQHEATLDEAIRLLTDFQGLAWRFHDTMHQHQEPLVPQILRELSLAKEDWWFMTDWDSVFFDDVSTMRAHRFRYIRCWYAYLVVKRFESDDALQTLNSGHQQALKALHGLLWSELVPLLGLLLEDLRALDQLDQPEDSYVARVHSMLWDFVKGGWKDRVEAHVDEYGHPESLCSLRDMRGVLEALPWLRFEDNTKSVVRREDIWLSVLSLGTPKKRMLLLCDSLLSEVTVSGPAALVMDDLRCEALQRLSQSADFHTTDLLWWLRSSGGERFPMAALQLVTDLELTGPEAEDAVLSLLERDTALSTASQEARWLAAMHLLQDIGTERSISPLEEHMAAWKDDPNTRVVYERAERLLKQLRPDEDIFSGALSPADETADEGQLSLTNDVEMEGQLSLNPSNDADKP